jgi:transcriptional regulator with XRE-family HTH domain
MPGRTLSPPNGGDHPIARYRHRKRLSLRAFAERVPMSYATLFQLEKGTRRMVRPELIRSMAAATCGAVSENMILQWHHRHALDSAVPHEASAS